MDPGLRGVINEGAIYFGKTALNLPFKVVSAKKVYSKMHDVWMFYVIDINHQAWVIYNNGNSYFLVTDTIKVIDIAIVGNLTVILSDDGKLFIQEEEVFNHYPNELTEINIGTSFISVSSGFHDELVAIDVDGNLWTHNPGLFSNNYVDKVNLFETQMLIRCTNGFNFIQVEFGEYNIICLDSEGSLYVLGDNSNHELCCINENIDTLTKILVDIKFRKIARTSYFTALIDFEDNLWVCGIDPSKDDHDPEAEDEAEEVFLSRKALSDVKDIYVGNHYIIAKLSDNAVVIVSGNPWPTHSQPIVGFNIVEDMRADKLFNNMDPGRKRFTNTKSSRNFV